MTIKKSNFIYLRQFSVVFSEICLGPQQTTSSGVSGGRKRQTYCSIQSQDDTKVTALRPVKSRTFSKKKFKPKSIAT